MLGVDVSAWQGEIDWRAVREARPDVRFAYVRIAGGMKDGRWQGMDPYAFDNVHAARAHGIAVGGYLPFSPPTYTPDEAAVEAVTYLAELGLLRGGALVPALDIEDTTRDWSRWTADLISAWRKLTGRACGGRVVVYSSGSFFDTYLPQAFDRADPRIGAWVGHWNGTPGATQYRVGGRAIMHQYTSKGTLPGVSRDVDMNATMPGVQLTDWLTES